MNDHRGYQDNFSALHPEIYFEGKQRVPKAEKMLRILRDALGADLAGLHVLDIGCSTGTMCSALGEHFGKVTGIDIDEPAIEHARLHWSSPHLEFRVGDAMATALPPDSIDVVVCAHVYEHVPDSRRMMEEIFRILRPGGVCYFAAENRLVLREGDYRLPFLSLLPKRLGNIYVRLARKADFYYETLLTYWQLADLTAAFQRIDYTRKVVVDPASFAAEEMIPPNSFKQRAALTLIDHAYWLFPNYLWILKKPAR